MTKIPTTETSKPSTRQWAQQQKLMAQDRCISCWKPKGQSATCRCDSCQKKDNARARLKHGYRNWKPGGPGRPPVKKNPKTGEYFSVISRKMSKMDYSLTNHEIMEIANVSEPTVRKYRKIYGGNSNEKVSRKKWTRQQIEEIPDFRRQYKTWIPFINWNATNDQISHATKIPRRTINNYRKKHAPETLPKRASRVAIAKSKSPAGGPCGKRQNTDGSGRSSKV